MILKMLYMCFDLFKCEKFWSTMFLVTLFEPLKDKYVVYTVYSYVCGTSNFGNSLWYTNLVLWKEYGFNDFILIENLLHYVTFLVLPYAKLP